jgi:hypothetical protein
MINQRNQYIQINNRLSNSESTLILVIGQELLSQQLQAAPPHQPPANPQADVDNVPLPRYFIRHSGISI